MLPGANYLESRRTDLVTSGMFFSFPAQRFRNPAAACSLQAGLDFFYSPDFFRGPSGEAKIKKLNIFQESIKTDVFPERRKHSVFDKSIMVSNAFEALRGKSTH